MQVVESWQLATGKYRHVEISKGLRNAAQTVLVPPIQGQPPGVGAHNLTIRLLSLAGMCAGFRSRGYGGGSGRSGGGRKW